MKINKILGALTLGALTISGAMAQVAFHSAVDFTTYGVQQDFYKTGDTSSHTDPTAGYDPDGSFTIDVNASAANFAFELGLYFNPDGGLSTNYYDFSDLYNTHFYKGNMSVGFLDNQLKVKLGKYEDFNDDMIQAGYVVEDQSISNLADSTVGQYLTGVEYAPAFAPGLRIFAGIPILPIMGNGEHYDAAYNQWKNLYKKAKLAATYTFPVLDFAITVNAGYRYGTFYDGIDAADSGTMALYTSNFTKSAFGEGYLQFVIPGLLDMFDVTASYDIRYRDSSYVNSSNETKEHVALAHYGQLGLSTKLLDNDMTLSVEDRFFFASDDYLKSDEKALWDMLAVNAEYAFPGTIFSVGADLAGMYAVDANGTGFVDGAINNSAYASDSDNITMTFNSMACATAPGTGATTYLGAYACPYFKVNFSNGALRIGAEVCYTQFATSSVTNTCLSYRVPVGLTFAF